MEKMYCLRSGEIQLQEVERKSKKSVWIHGRRHPRTTNYQWFFETEKEAAQYLLHRLDLSKYRTEKGIENAKEKLKRLETKITETKLKYDL